MTIPFPKSVVRSQSPPQQQEPLSVPEVPVKCPPQLDFDVSEQSYMHWILSLSREESSVLPRVVTEGSVAVITVAPSIPKLTTKK